MEYIDYLQTAGYLLPEVEDLDLEDLQGAQGLKALRVTVNLQETVSREQTLPELARAARRRAQGGQSKFQLIRRKQQH